jgi:hypothetical protein
MSNYEHDTTIAMTTEIHGKIKECNDLAKELGCENAMAETRDRIARWRSEELEETINIIRFKYAQKRLVESLLIIEDAKRWEAAKLNDPR